MPEWTVALVTRGSVTYVERTLHAVRSFADELVAVDGSSTDDTQDISLLATTRIDCFGSTRSATGRGHLCLAHRPMSGRLAVGIDDDEVPSGQLVLALPGLLADRDVTHYWFRRRWLAEPEGKTWFADSRWWPNWQLRLFRNIRSTRRMRARGRSCPTDVRGDPPCLRSSLRGPSSSTSIEAWRSPSMGQYSCLISK